MTILDGLSIVALSASATFFLLVLIDGKILLRRCSWCPKGRRMMSLPHPFGTWLSVFLESYPISKIFQDTGIIMITDGLCKPCAKKINENLKALDEAADEIYLDCLLDEAMGKR